MEPDKPWDAIVPIRDVDHSLLCDFRCGIAEFDAWLRESACSAVKRGECAVHVCIEGNGSPIAFFTLSSTSIHSDDLSNGHKGGLHGPVPATLLGKMGVRVDLQGMGYGTKLLHNAMQFALRSADLVSSRLLAVDAHTSDLIPWYEKRGFTKIPGSERRLVCKMSRIRKICESEL